VRIGGPASGGLLVAALLLTPVPGPAWTPLAMQSPVIAVALDGDDAASGTRAAPFRTIARAAAVSTPGATIVVTAGTYRESVRTTASGTAAAPITYVSEPAGAARIVGDGSVNAAWRNDGDHVEIRGFDITGVNVDGLLTTGSYGRIVGNRVSGFRSGACILTARSGYTLHDIDVIGNVVSHCGRSHLEHGIYVSHPGGTVANNISYGNAGYGIHCWHNCNRLVISNNLVFANAVGGIVVGQGDGPHHGTVAADGFVVSNNIAVDNGGHGIRESGATGPDNRFLHNNVFGNAEGGLDLVTGVASGTVSADPGFVDYRPDGSGDYRLVPTSPNVDAGTPIGAPGTDIDGTRRPRGRGVDIGVYER
jgi:hypothetical protein